MALTARGVNQGTIVPLEYLRLLLMSVKLAPVTGGFPLVAALMGMDSVNVWRTTVGLGVISVMKDFMAFLTANHVIVIQWVQVGVCVDPQVISVRVSPVTLVPSVISVLQDIMDFQTAESATVIGLARYHLMSVMPLLGSAIVVKCTLPDSVISVVRDSTVFLNVKFVTVMLRVQLGIFVTQTPGCAFA